MRNLLRKTSWYPGLLAIFGAVLILVGLGFVVRWRIPSSVEPRSAAATLPVVPAGGASPRQMEVKDASGAWRATFTYGARTVLLHGPTRKFAEPSTTSAVIVSSDWVRLYPKPFDGTVDQAWLSAAEGKDSANEPDIFQIAMQYIAGTPTIKDASGQRIAGDAGYGQADSSGSRQGGSDFNDYLGIAHTYGTVVDKPEAAQLGDLDCSGFQRMVWGYRSGLPLELEPTGGGIPRRAYQILDNAPGVVVIPDNGRQVTDFSRLQPGDLVFHDAGSDDGARIDHIGMYLGVDSQGDHRFISSRKVANGPTFGDDGGRSVLDGTGLYAKSFRAVRRL